MTTILWSALALGFILGLRHALDPDHVVAVSTLASTEPNWRRSSLSGSFWGLGHATSLLTLGGLILAFRLEITERSASRLEVLVAVMLVVLGMYAVNSARSGFRLHAHPHKHDGSTHDHLHAHPAPGEPVHQHVHPLRFGLRPYLVGLVHGVAGSGGLALLVTATSETAAAGFLYMVALALGAMVGMSLLSALMTLPLSVLRVRYETLHLRFQYLSGVFSVALGLWLASESFSEWL